LKWPGLGPSVDDGLHYQGDVAATILDLLGLDTPAAWDFAGFGEQLKAGQLAGRDHLVVSQCAWSCQRSVLHEKWLMIRTYHTGLKEFPSVMLFDTEADPHLQHNLADQHTDVVAKLQTKLDEWHDEMMRTSDVGVDPLQQVMAEGGPYHTRTALDMYAQRLRDTGRGHHADFLETHGGRPINLP